MNRGNLNRLFSPLLNTQYIVAIIHSKLATQAARYFVVGGFCTIVDMALLFVLTHFCHVYYCFSAICSFSAGAVISYFLCVSWVFDVRVVEKRHREFVYYLVLSAIGLGLSTSLIWAFTELVGLYYMLSKLIATFITYWVNFGTRKYFLHTRR
jgi:putative flippase GtrA